jgi:hypothetical protein
MIGELGHVALVLALAAALYQTSVPLYGATTGDLRLMEAAVPAALTQLVLIAFALAEDFIADLHESWQTHGKTAIERCVAEKPDVYLKIVAGLLPKDVNLKVSNLDDLTDEQLLNKLNSLTEMARPLLARIGDTAVRADVRAEPIVDADYTDISNA